MKKALVILVLLTSLRVVAQATPCNSNRDFRISNAWQPSQVIPYGMVMEVFNPLGSGCDLYITGLTLSAGSNLSYVEFGGAFATSLMPGCVSNLQVIDLSTPTLVLTLPGGISGVGLPCGAYVPIGTTTDGRWVLANGHPYDEDFKDKPRRLSPGVGYSIWTSPAGYPVIQSALGDLSITLTAKTCPVGIAC